MSQLDRRASIGGGDIGAIVGLSPFKTALDVWIEKTGRGQPEDPGPRADWGNRLESLVLDRFEEDGVRLYRNRLPDGTQESFFHGELAWARATPDAWHVGQSRGVDAKTTGRFSEHRWGPDGSDEIPPEYLAQGQWYCSIMGWGGCDFPVLVDGAQFRILSMEADPEFGAMLLDRAGRFWFDHVQKDEPPPVQTPEERLALQAALHPRCDIRHLLPSTPELDKLALELREVKARMAHLEHDEIRIRAALTEVIGGAAGLEGAWGKILLQESKPRKSIDWEAVAKAQLEGADLARRLELTTKFMREKAFARRFVARFAK